MTNHERDEINFVIGTLMGLEIMTDGIARDAVQKSSIRLMKLLEGADQLRTELPAIASHSLSKLWDSEVDKLHVHRGLIGQPCDICGKPVAGTEASK